MFTKPINEIAFEDIESFCEEWPEGVRVEYKLDVEEIKGKIPKIVSSFANDLGGIFLIGVEADQVRNEVISIPGVPQQKGIDEKIQKSALDGIYPAVIPEVKIVNVPDSENMVVVVRVDESVQAPHAIQNSTRIYIRTGSITNPYDLADMDRINYMFKRREDSQVVARQILDRIERRTGHRFRPAPDRPDLTIIAQPVFPYRPVISASDIYNLCETKLSSNIRRVQGGISYVNGPTHFEPNRMEYFEFNEYGVVYRRIVLSVLNYDGKEDMVDLRQFLIHINCLIEHTMDLYKKCEYLGNIEISVKLQEVLDKRLTDQFARDNTVNVTGNLYAKPKCNDTEVFTSIQCFTRDLENKDKRKDIVEDLMCQLLWAFNVAVDKPNIRENVGKRIEWELS